MMKMLFRASRDAPHVAYLSAVSLHLKRRAGWEQA